MSMYRARNGDLSKSLKNSITDILPNRSSDSIERHKFQNSQNASLLKAINNLESPPKEKHVRNLILGTFHERSVLPFWYNALKLQLYGNAIVCWKFCYTLHKMMRDGFGSTVEESFRYVATLEDLAKSWIHLKHDYGNMLFHYCNFLSFKLKFHKKNKLIPANLQIEINNLNELASNDISNYFQFCCDFFDYLDEILAVQNVIFVSMDRNRNNSMTEAGQCKLTPLVLCVQESNQLYDFCVNFMFKLHETLPGDTLEGHRERFYKMFRQLSKFYECCRNLQYFKSLITIPELPPNPPNFHQLSDFDLYKKPTMMVVEPAPSECDSSIQEEDSILLDFSDTQTERSATPTNHQESLLQQQQNQFIQQLIQEIERLRAELDRLTFESETEIRKLRTRIKELEDELIAQRSEVEQERIRNANLEEKIKIASESEKAKVDLDNLEKKAVSSEEKFNKMKDLYTKLKNEHVNLLRQEADMRKQKASLAETCEHAKKMQREMEKRLEEEVAEKSKLETSLQAKVAELQSVKSETEKSQSDRLAINQKHDMELRLMEEEKCDLVNELHDLTQSLQLAEETQRKLEQDARKAKEKVAEMEAEMSKHKVEMAALNAKLSDSTREKQNADADFAALQNKLRSSVYLKTLDNCEQLIRDALHLFDDPVLLNCKSGAEFLLNNLSSFGDKFAQLTQNYAKHLQTADDADTFATLIRNVNTFSKLIADTVVSGKITSLTAADFNQGEQLADLCRHVGQDSLGLLAKMKQKEADVSDEERKLNDLMKRVVRTLTDLLPKVHDINKEEIGDLIDQEMQKTSEAIESAVAKLELLINKSREQETGVKLEVNDKILDACTGLMKAIKVLIVKAKELQREIVTQGRGASTVKEFYAKNYKWTEGLVSAAKLVGLGANVLIEKADKLVNGNGKIEEIIVCSNEIAASTAQLVVSSNVKANRESPNRVALIDAKTNVSNATAALVASAKSCLQIIDDQTAMDFTGISLHQTKRLEMEVQVKVLELEKQLEAEKKKLYKLRKQHYQLEAEKEEQQQKDAAQQ